MIIERIEIIHFGKLHHKSYDLSPGVNVFYGENESGKSTLAAFVRYMLYGFGTQASPTDLPEREKRISWESGTAEGEMDIRLSDRRRYRLKRKTVLTPQGGRIFYREESAILDPESGEELPGGEIPGLDFFSVPENVFLNTAFIGQIPDSRVNEGEMSTAIENILFSGNERTSTHRAIRAMEQAMRSISHSTPQKNTKELHVQTGAIIELIHMQHSLRSRLSRALTNANKVFATEAELSRERRKLLAAEQEYRRLQSEKEDYEIATTICSFDRLHEGEKELSRITAELDALRRTSEEGGFLPDSEYLYSLTRAEQTAEIARQNYLRTEEALRVSRAEAVLSEEAKAVLDKSETRGGVLKIKEEYRENAEAKVKTFRLGWAAVSGALLFLLLIAFFVRPGTSAPFFSSPLLVISAAAALLLGMVSGFLFHTSHKYGLSNDALCLAFGATTEYGLVDILDAALNAKAEFEAKQSKLTMAQENLTIAEEYLEIRRDELRTLASRWNKNPVTGSTKEALEAVSKKVEEYLAKEKDLTDQIKGLQYTVNSLRESDALRGKSEVEVRSKIPPKRREEVLATNPAVRKEQLAYYSDTLNTLRAQCANLERILHERESACESPAALRIELSVIDRRISALGQKQTAYQLALDILKNATSRLHDEIAPRLTQYAAEWMKKASGGRYAALAVSSKLSMSHGAEEGTPYPLPYLSGSVQSLAYLSLRLALIDMLYEEKPPLLFDESFSYQDGERLPLALDALSEIADKEEMQSLLFTCHESVASTAEALTFCRRYHL